MEKTEANPLDWPRKLLHQGVCYLAVAFFAFGVFFVPFAFAVPFLAGDFFGDFLRGFLSEFDSVISFSNETFLAIQVGLWPKTNWFA